MSWLETFWKGPKAPPQTTNFTPNAQKALSLSRKEAMQLNHNFVGTEHLLLGLLVLGCGTGVTALHNMGLTSESVRAEVLKQVGIGPDQKMIGNPPFTPRVKKVLALAIKEATAMAHQHVGTEHIVLGLLREGDGVAAHVLKALNVDIEKTRAEVLKLYQAGSAAADGSKPDETAAPARASEADFSGNLTPRAQRALVLARDEADALNLSYVGTEHVLMGLIRLGRGVAVNVLAKIELNSETVGARLEALAGRRPVEKSGERPYYALLVKEALSFASEEARNLDHTYIGTEHILLGLLRQREGGAASIFKNLNIDTEAVRREILTELIPNFSSTPEIPMQPNPSSPRREPVDLNLRYDVYCAERNLKVVVYRDVQFKAVKTLFPRHERDLLSDFVELEQRDGQIVFVAKSTVIRFCQHGMNPQGKIETGES